MVEKWEIYGSLDLSSEEGFCSPVAGECADIERIAIAVSGSMGDGAIRVFDHGQAHLSFFSSYESYHIIVENAVKYSNFRCTDIPQRWFRFVIFTHLGD